MPSSSIYRQFTCTYVGSAELAIDAFCYRFLSTVTCFGSGTPVIVAAILCSRSHLVLGTSSRYSCEYGVLSGSVALQSMPVVVAIDACDSQPASVYHGCVRFVQCVLRTRRLS
jgi:hypothetical protein